MYQNTTCDSLIHHLCASYDLPIDDARQLVLEVVHYFRESPEEFTRRRHQELQGAGLANAEIFSRIRTEIDGRRFPAGSVSLRQIRRMIYG